MRIGLLADTHDRLPAVAALVARMAERSVELVLHAGDWCAPFALRPVHELALPVVGVFGRSDGDREGLRVAAAAGLATELFESPHSLEIGGERLLLVHDLNESVERSVASHAFVVHGCTHRAEQLERDGALLVNPGEACGWLHGVPTAAVLDLTTRTVEFLRLTEPEWRV
ncbi:MAG TPA: YfcE family phosphodiesterase [Gemmatimonadaceae bacterium]|jgi:hypothetical protein|nr:YfcE family phosphodiesterase [Gemmatimonadaceae bacterium]HVK73956.1 YfcE family phosphodiesterase [Kofleriaceae bacterium]